MNKLIIAALMALSMTPAVAGDNSCVGTVLNGRIDTSDYISATGKFPAPPNNDCKFDPKSKIGKRIFSKCPIGSICNVELPLDDDCMKIRRALNIEQQ